MFSADDTAQMKEIMMTDRGEHFLEELGFLLCLHLRNFIAGTSILTNITNAILGSRRVILLLSRYEKMHCDDLISAYITQKKTVLKQYPLGTTLENGTLFAKWHSFFLNNHAYQKNSTTFVNRVPFPHIS